MSAQRRATVRAAVVQDIRFAIRSMVRSPGVFAIIVLTIALGVGVNAAMFAVLDRILFRQPDGVVRAAEVKRLYYLGHSRGGPAGYSDWFSAVDYDALRTAASSPARVEGYYPSDDWYISDDSARVAASRVTGGLFDMLGVRPERGRFFAADEMRYGDPRFVAVISDALWRRQFGADSNIVGRQVTITAYKSRQRYTIIGVAQPGFTGIDVDPDDMWVPFTARGTPGEGGSAWWLQRGTWYLTLIARIPDAVPVAATTAKLTMAIHSANAGVGDWFDPHGAITAAPLIQARGPRSPDVGARNLSVATRLGGMAFAVLVLAITNAMALLLMRALRRRREIAIRMALGISRRRLVAQLLVESAIVAVAAGSGALVATAWTGGVLRALLFTRLHWPQGVLDGRMTIVVATLAVAASAASALAPLTIIVRRDLTAALRLGGAETGHPGSRLRTSLFVAQGSICIALLAAAGVFIQSFRRAASFDVGFDASQTVKIMASGYGSNPPAAAFDEAAARLANYPGVNAVARSTGIGEGSWGSSFQLPGQDSIRASVAPQYDYVDANLFTASGIHVLTGRAIDASDVNTGASIAVVNQSMARRFWPGTAAVGQCFFGPAVGCVRVVGVMADVRESFADEVKPTYLMPMDPTFVRQMQGLRPILLHFRAPLSTESAAAFTKTVKSMIGPVSGMVSVFWNGESYQRQLRPWRVSGLLCLVFGVLALVSAACGVYGLVAYDVERRTREIGIRSTLGATPARVVRDVLMPTARVTAIGMAIGVVGAILSGRVLASLLFETSPADPAVLMLTVGVLLVAALAASVVPAWRATRVDPVVALRAE